MNELFTADMAGRARWARDHNESQPKGVWSTGERVIVALILGNAAALREEGETEQSARSRLAGDIGVDDVTPWLERVRQELDR